MLNGLILLTFLLFFSIFCAEHNHHPLTLSQIAQRYSHWAMGDKRSSMSPRYLNHAPVQQFVHSIRVQIPKPPTTEQSSSSTPPPSMPITKDSYRPTTIAPFPYIPPSTRIEPESRVLQRASIVAHNSPRYVVMKSPPMMTTTVAPIFESIFPRLLENRVDNVLHPTTLFTSNATNFPNHTSNPTLNFIPSHPTNVFSSIDSPSQPSYEVVANPNLKMYKDKDEARELSSKKQKYGMPRFRQAFSPCLDGWCGNECCKPRHQIVPPFHPMQTIQATALPGSPTPSHPLVLVVHPSPLPQCSPACQPECNVECVSRLQYFQESSYFNTINEPMCRPDCMPSCHVDCLIIPPEKVRCNSFRCQCAAGYVSCAAFTCCMRYPNMAARMRQTAQKSIQESQEIEEINEDEDRRNNEESFRRQYSPIVSKISKYNQKFESDNFGQENGIFYTKTKSKNPYKWKKSITTLSPPPPPSSSSATTTINLCATSATTSTTVIASTTSTTTTTTPPPSTTSTTTSTTTTTTTLTPSTTSNIPTTKPTPTSTTSEFEVSNSTVIMKMTPVYPDVKRQKEKRPIPMIPAFEIWSIPEATQEMTKSNSMLQNRPTSFGDLRSRHVIRSENFLDVLSELAQVKLKEDIGNDFSHAADLIELMMDKFKKS